jgi:tRNA threonylcarbamoyladenosine biosynthesis protein TsaB
MLTLAIETAGPACSVALIDGSDIVAGRHELVGRGHAERLIPWIAALPGGGRADRIIVGCGPGSFTGVRIGIAAARGLGLGWSIPVFGVSSLALLAADCPFDEFAVAAEGGHGELLVQMFRRSPLGPVGDYASLSPEAAAAQISAAVVTGAGAELLVSARGFGTVHHGEPRASAVAALPPALLIADVRPIYARAPDAKPMAA